MAFLKKKWVWVLFVAVVFIFFLYIKKANENDIKYMTAVAKKGDVEVSILATGILKPYRLVAVGARTTGRVIAMHARAGDKVDKDELLAEIDPTTQKNALEKAKAALAMNQAKLIQQQTNLKLAKKKLMRTQTLISAHSISQADYDNTAAQEQIQQSIIDSLNAEKIQAQVDISNAEADLSYTRISAPIPGTVLAIVVQEGQTINAAQTAPTVAIIGDLSKMRVYAQISEADIMRAHVGQKVYFTVLGDPTKRYKAVVENIEPAPELIRSDINVNPSTQSSFIDGAIYYNATFTVDNPDNILRTYMTAETHILLAYAQDVLTIPSDALDNVNGNKAQVRVMTKTGQAKLCDVEIGINDKIMVEIKKGLKEGDVVITGSSEGLPPITNDNDKHRMKMRPPH